MLEGIDRIGVVRLHGTDVVRHELVQKIVRAYENANKGEGTDNGQNDNG